jgi:Domain of unknown function (DUF5753)
MASQLQRLADAGSLPNVSVRVLPFSAGLHHGLMSGPFVILRFPLNGEGREAEPTTVYVDGFTGDLYLDKPNEIERYNEAYASISGSSLDEPSSKELILQSARELGQQ